MSTIQASDPATVDDIKTLVDGYSPDAIVAQFEGPWREARKPVFACCKKTAEHLAEVMDWSNLMIMGPHERVTTVWDVINNKFGENFVDTRQCCRYHSADLALDVPDVRGLVE